MFFRLAIHFIPMNAFEGLQGIFQFYLGLKDEFSLIEWSKNVIEFIR